MIEVIRPGVLTTVQDAGRTGHRAFGMPVAGALDGRALALANLLAGNPREAAALELTLAGGTFRLGRDAYLALAGADMGATLDGAPVPAWSAFGARAGAVLALGPARDGARTYLAVHGGISVPPVLGSRATYLRGAIGGFEGRALAPGDRVPFAPGDPPGLQARRLPAAMVPRLGAPLALRVLLGPQDDRFRREGVAAFLGGSYTVSNRNDRMGYQLEGPAIAHADGADIVSDALLPGAVQVPGNGQPIVLMADCQTTGGYAKVAAVIGPDLPDLAQARRGDLVRFVRCTMAQAVGAVRRERDRLAAAAAVLAPGGAR